ncbi:succinate dehydrogenase iron-sulfur subunit [bacterium]|nr:succinate dehydrogenase iron-sulfur subunit [bacterium]
MLRILNIERYQPDDRPAKRVDGFTMEMADDDRILDLLIRVHEDLDPTMVFRASCGHGVCGSDGMMIQGQNRLACQTFVGDFPGTGPIVVGPLRGYKVLRDLVVDMEPLTAKYEGLKPWVESGPPPPDGREGLQSQADLELIEEMTKCIMCACCTSACPSFWWNPAYLGPAAMVQAARFAFDTRNTAANAMLERVLGSDGIHRCHTATNCTDACPRGIDVTGVMGALKRAMLSGLPEPTAPDAPKPRAQR